MSGNELNRITILFNQGRYKETIELLESYLESNADDYIARYTYIAAHINIGEKTKGRELAETFLAEYPDSEDALSLSISADIADQKLEKAQSKVELLIEMDPNNAQAHVLDARIWMGQRNYDQALAAATEAIELDPENLEAYNLTISLEGLLGKEQVNTSLEHAMELDPENASTIANHGMQLLREGKVKEALERLQTALEIDPTNELARYYMTLALKSRFWPYRMLMKYGEAMALLGEKGSWVFIVGSYILLQVIRKLSDTMPFLVPVVYLIIGLFLLSWVLTPIMNLYLFTNKYGRILLDKDEKTMAKGVGITLLLSLICFICAITTGIDRFYYMALVFAAFMIPLGTFLSPVSDANRKKTKSFTIGILAAGIIGIVINVPMISNISLIGVFIYQWVINGLLIRENSRVF